jgi:hypothetical protein
MIDFRRAGLVGAWSTVIHPKSLVAAQPSHVYCSFAYFNYGIVFVLMQLGQSLIG